MKLLLLPFLITSLWAQNAPPPKHLRMIPLGEEAPMIRAGLKDKLLHFKEAPPGAVIPKDLGLAAGKAILPLQLNLLSPSRLLTLDGKTKTLLFKTDGKEWLKRKAPAIPLTLGVLYRDPKTMSWNDPKLLLLKDDASTFPAGSVRFVNTSDVMVLIRIGGEKTRTSGLMPGRALTKTLKFGDHKIWIGYQTPDNPEATVLNNNISLPKNERLQFFFYKSQKKNPRHPFLQHNFPEEVPKLP